MTEPRTRRRLAVAAAISFVAVAAWRLCPVVLAGLGEFLVKAEPPEPADIIVVLGGDFWGPRVLKGAELGARGFAPRVLISGPPYGSQSESDLAIRFLVEKGYAKELFLGFPHQAKSTIDEARVLGPELRRLGVRKAILVTRASHSRRASLVFRLYCPEARFVSVPAVDEFQARQWWSDERSRRLCWKEWCKIAGTVMLRYAAY